MQQTQLQIRTGYSFMKSTLQIDTFVNEAARLGYGSLAITDEFVMHGAIHFYQACKKAGIKPIIGLSGTVSVDGTSVPMLFLARNFAGYQVLLQWSSNYQNSEDVTLEMLADQKHHLTYILPVDQAYLWQSDSFIGHLDQQLQFIQDIPVTLGVSTATIDVWQQLKSYTEQTSRFAVALSDIRYLYKKDRQAYHCYRAIATGDYWQSYQLPENEGMHLPTVEELQEGFYQWPALVDNANQIADQCHVNVPLNQRLLPKYPLDNGQTADDYLEQLCLQALKRHERHLNTTYTERLYHELDVIRSMGFSDYFLIVWDFIQYARNQEIMVGPGRGSAAGSLVAYLLNITDVDPIRYQLLFERFLNPERVSMPDIDIDFADDRRDEVIQYVVDTYGKKHVAQIATFGTFAARSLLRELFKTMEVSDDDARYILKYLPKESNITIAAMLKQTPELVDYIKQSHHLQQVFKIAHRLEGLPRHVSTHAAGVIISDQPLTNYTALMIPSNQDHYLTQFAMKDLETVGLLKMDFLGLRNLTLLDKVRKQIEYRHQEVFPIEAIPFDNQKTFELLRKGRTNGIFQLESQGMKSVLQRLVPNHFEDIVAVNALYRPGPMDFIPTYIARKHGQESVTYIHPDLAEILEPTFGVLVYQEQIMQVANKMAGYHYGDADILRRAVSKKEKAAMERQRELFIAGCKRNGYSMDVAEELFDWIVRFSNYGFNRSHAVAYSVIAYQLAYVKANYPVSFFTEMLSLQIGNPEKLQLYFREAKQFGIEMLPPSINKSIGKFRAEHQSIRIGLSIIKGFGFQAVKEVMNARKKDGPFRSLFDFCLRVSTRVLNRKMIEALILAGAFDEIHSNRATLLANLDEALEQGELFHEFDDQVTFLHDLAIDASYDEMDPFPVMKQLMMEKEVIGFFVSTHPLLKMRDELRESGYISVEDAKHAKRRYVSMVAAVQSLKVIRTKKGESMAFATLSDETGEIESVLFPHAYREVNHWIEEDLFVTTKGRVDERRGNTQYIVEQLQPFDIESEQMRQARIYIQINADEEATTIDYLRSLANQYPGRAVVYVYHQDQKQLFKLSKEYWLENHADIIQQLRSRFGNDNVAVQ
ncbi:DNA polymerase III subunit alpha [Gracilibacillus halophilus YIM-C55.5]|uniref:DNA polymerase III subunit alpha n=1 Tax=Gracilibacillus halophilus YIM-C55.5 TaxID=1308866 RepID=N4WV24_9BACI|nr:DNA polymerase III subunit alpha [Gracilibacillus halophilus]ENH96951.1 DNA polymerase III subunit alpha [Gracilibacillus halophilus YIM-C55.5]